jgi:hypothetical protein
MRKGANINDEDEHTYDTEAWVFVSSSICQQIQTASLKKNRQQDSSHDKGLHGRMSHDDKKERPPTGVLSNNEKDFDEDFPPNSVVVGRNSYVANDENVHAVAAVTSPDKSVAMRTETPNPITLENASVNVIKSKHSDTCKRLRLAGTRQSCFSSWGVLGIASWHYRN